MNSSWIKFQSTDGRWQYLDRARVESIMTQDISPIRPEERITDVVMESGYVFHFHEHTTAKKILDSIREYLDNRHHLHE